MRDPGGPGVADHADEGIPDEVVRAVFASGDLDGIERLFDRMWFHLPALYSTEILRAISAMPQSELERRPRLLVAGSLAHSFGRAGRAQNESRLVEFHQSWGARAAAFWSTLSDPGDLVAAGGTAFIGARIAWDLDRADAIARQLEDRLGEVTDPQLPWDELPSTRGGWIAMQQSLTALLAGDQDRAMSEAVRAYRRSGSGPYREWFRRETAGQTALLATLHGYRDLAVEWLGKHDRMPVLPQIEHLALLPERLARLHLALDALDRDAAEEALPLIGRGTDTVEMWPFVATAHARFGLVFGDPRRALAELDEARFAHGLQGRHLDIGGFALARARADLLAATGDLEAVLALRRRFPRARTLAVPASVAILRAGDPESALESARSALAEEPAPRDAVSLSLVAAAALLRLGDLDGAHAAGSPVITEISSQGDHSALLALAPDDVAALARLAGVPDPLGGVAVGRPAAPPQPSAPPGRAPASDGLPLPNASALWRQRIADRISDSARLVVVRGEGGAGKSTFAVELLERRRHEDATMVWIPFDALGRSRHSAWHRIASALRGRGLLEPGDALSAYLTGGLALDDVPGSLVDGILARGRRLRVVLDDVHFLDDDAQESLAQVVERTPLLSVVVTARTRTRFDDPALLARTGGVIIDSGDLAATDEEVRELAERAGIELSPPQVGRLMAATGGNMLAVRVAIAELGRVAVTTKLTGPDLTSRIVRATRRAVLPEFASDDVRDAALRLSLAPAITPSLALRLSGRDDVDRILDSFQRDGLGDYRNDPAAPTFTFHVLVAEALRGEAESRLPAEEVTAHRRMITRHLEEAGDSVAAIGLLVQIGDYDEVWRVVVEDFSELTLHRVDDLVRILETVPKAELESNGTLAVSLAVMLSERESSTSSRVRRLVDAGLRSLAALPSTADPREQYRRLLARFAALRVARLYEEAAIAGELAVAHATSLPGSEVSFSASDGSIGMLQLTITEVLAGRLSTAITRAHALDHADHSGRESYRLALLAESHALQGDMRDVALALAEADALDAPEWKASIFSVATRVARASLRTDRGDPRAALDLLDGIGDRLDFTEHWPYVLWARAVARLVSEQAHVGLDELGFALRRFQVRGVSQFALNRIAAVRADLYLAAARPDRARALLAEAGDDHAVVLARARVALAEDGPGAALRVLDGVDWDDAAPRQASEMLLLSGILNRRLGHGGAATEAFARASRVLADSGLVVPLAMVPRAELAESGIDLPAALDGLGDPFGALADRPRLTPREREVLEELVITGATDRIAARFHVSQNTVKSQLKSLYRKLGVSARAEALDAARRFGLL